jgi:hypothetical protein
VKFPEFIISGFGRCGTSALLLNLGQHPDIQIALGNGTELRFWNGPQSIESGLEKYKNRFYGKVTGEKTPSYCYKPDTIQTISEYIPDVKIILCLRNPVDRAISHFELHKRWGRIKTHAEFDLNKHRAIMKAGEYMFYIERCILPSIPEKNIYFSIMEWTKEDLNSEMVKLYEFLGLAPYEAEVEKTVIESKVNNELPYLELFKENTNYHVWSQSYHKEIIDTRELYDYFKPHNDKLFEFLGYEIKEWRL